MGGVTVRDVDVSQFKPSSTVSENCPGPTLLPTICLCFLDVVSVRRDIALGDFSLEVFRDDPK